MTFWGIFFLRLFNSDWKTAAESKKSEFLDKSAYLDSKFDPQVARLVEIHSVLHVVLKFGTPTPYIVSFLFLKSMPG